VTEERLREFFSEKFRLAGTFKVSRNYKNKNSIFKNLKKIMNFNFSEINSRKDFQFNILERIKRLKKFNKQPKSRKSRKSKKIPKINENFYI